MGKGVGEEDEGSGDDGTGISVFKSVTHVRENHESDNDALWIICKRVWFLSLRIFVLVILWIISYIAVSKGKRIELTVIPRCFSYLPQPHMIFEGAQDYAHQFLSTLWSENKVHKFQNLLQPAKITDHCVSTTSLSVIFIM